MQEVKVSDGWREVTSEAVGRQAQCHHPLPTVACHTLPAAYVGATVPEASMSEPRAPSPALNASNTPASSLAVALREAISTSMMERVKESKLMIRNAMFDGW